MLQQPATSRSTLQLTATHCNTRLLDNPCLPRHTLQHDTNQCNTMQDKATHCTHTATHCSTLQQCNNTLQHTAVHCSTVSSDAETHALETQTRMFDKIFSFHRRKGRSVMVRVFVWFNQTIEVYSDYKWVSFNSVTGRMICQQWHLPHGCTCPHFFFFTFAGYQHWWSESRHQLNTLQTLTRVVCFSHSSGSFIYTYIYRWAFPLPYTRWLFSRWLFPHWLSSIYMYTYIHRRGSSRRSDAYLHSLALVSLALFSLAILVGSSFRSHSAGLCLGEPSANPTTLPWALDILLEALSSVISSLMSRAL